MKRKSSMPYQEQTVVSGLPRKAVSLFRFLLNSRRTPRNFTLSWSNGSARTPRNDSKAFTLIELLVAGAIFAIVSLIAVGIFINVSKSNRRINLENHIYSEAYILMEKLAREVKKGTIDYEEYHSRLVMDATPNDIADDMLGANYGEYAKKFYHPGYCTNQSSSECTVTGIDKGFGLLCNDQTRRYPGADTDPDYPCTPYQPSQDIRGGMNPYLGFHTDTAETEIDSTKADQSTAFCDSLHNRALDTATTLNKDCDSDSDNTIEAADFQSLHTQEQLYLINGSGDQKTMIAREKTKTDPDGTGPATDEYALSFVRLSGEDVDQDDIREIWTCTKDFICTAESNTKPDPEDLTCLNSLNGKTCNEASNTPELLSSENFIPLTPSDINVASLKFLVSPLEDPFKAYEEYSAEYDYILMQPYVTIVLTVKPSYEKAKNIYPNPANLPEITLQTTVSARAYNEITSY